MVRPLRCIHPSYSYCLPWHFRRLALLVLQCSVNVVTVYVHGDLKLRRSYNKPYVKSPSHWRGKVWACSEEGVYLGVGFFSTGTIHDIDIDGSCTGLEEYGGIIQHTYDGILCLSQSTFCDSRSPRCKYAWLAHCFLLRMHVLKSAFSLLQTHGRVHTCFKESFGLLRRSCTIPSVSSSVSNVLFKNSELSPCVTTTIFPVAANSWMCGGVCGDGWEDR